MPPIDSELATHPDELQSVIEALRAEEVDAVVGQRRVSMLRLRDAEQARQRAEEELRRLNADLERRVGERTAQLRILMHQLEDTEQRERRRLAALLHDDLQQLLVAARMRVGHQLQRDDAQVRQGLHEIEGLLNLGIEATRSLASQLMPPAMDATSLGDALRWWCEQTLKLYHLPVQVLIDPQAEPDAGGVRRILFVCARELLLNVAKHAQATEAWLTLRTVGQDYIELEVRDNGVGNGAYRGPVDGHAPSMGLSSINERMKAIGGTIHLESAPGEGYKVCLMAPLSSAVSDADD